MLHPSYAYPPSLHKAELHQRATVIFKARTGAPVKCECCDRLVADKQNPGVCYDSKRMAFLGQGIPLYFLMMKNVLVLLTTSLLFLGVYGLYSNYMGSECYTGTTACQVTIFNQLSILNKATHTTELQIQNYLVLTLIVMLILVMQYVRRTARMLESECDRIVDSPSDYSMILRRLPNDYTEQDIRDMVDQRKKFLDTQQLHETHGLAIEKIVMAYSLKEFTEILEANAETYKQSVKKKTQFVEKPLTKTKKLAPTAIVTFSSQKSKDLFITEPKFYQKIVQFFWSAFIPATEYTVRGKFVSIQRAPEPDDINWANCGISAGGTIFRRLMGLLFTLLFLAIGAGVQIGLQYLDQKILVDPSVKVYSSTVFSIVVTIFNGVMSALLIVVTKKERLETVTEYNQRLAVKITLYQFINAGILVVVSNSIFILDFDQFSSKFSLAKGLAADITQIMIINVVAPNIALFILNYWAPGKWWARRSIKKELESEKEVPGTVYLQEQINAAYQGPEINLAQRYSFVLRTMLLTALFCPFTPIVIPLAILSIGLNYLIEKFLFVRSYKVPNMTSSILDNEMIELLEYFPLVLSLGNYFLYLYFVYFQFDQVPLYYGIPIYISIVISVVNIFLPMDSLNVCLFPLKNLEVHRPSFRQSECKFITDYDIANPIYRLENKKHKNYQLFAALAPLGGMFQMANLNKQGEQSTEMGYKQWLFRSPGKSQIQPLLNKNAGQELMNLFDPKAAHNPTLTQSVKNRVQEMSSSGSVRSLLPQLRPQQKAPQPTTQPNPPLQHYPTFTEPTPVPFQPLPQVARANSLGLDLGAALSVGVHVSNQQRNVGMAMALNANNQLNNLFNPPPPPVMPQPMPHFQPPVNHLPGMSQTRPPFQPPGFTMGRGHHPSNRHNW